MSAPGEISGPNGARRSPNSTRASANLSAASSGEPPAAVGLELDELEERFAREYLAIRAGLRTLLAADANAFAAVFLLCDQPFISPDIISRLTEAHCVTRSPIIASSYEDSFGVPVLFSRMCFAELAQLEGGAGAKHLACDRSEREPVRPSV